MKAHAIINNSELLELLKKLGICYKRYKHQPIYNVADAEKYAKNIDGAHCKNLFLTDAKGKLYLAVTLEKKRVVYVQVFNSRFFWLLKNPKH